MSANAIENVVKEVSHNATDAFDKALPAVEAALNSAKDTMKTALHDTSKTIKKYPLQSLLVGFGVGCVVGLVLRNARS